MEEKKPINQLIGMLLDDLHKKLNDNYDKHRKEHDFEVGVVSKKGEEEVATKTSGNPAVDFVAAMMLMTTAACVMVDKTDLEGDDMEILICTLQGEVMRMMDSVKEIVENHRKEREMQH